MDTLTTLFSHNLWANLRLLEQCALLSEEQLQSSLTGTFGSIEDTLQHIALAERAYYSRISTGERYDFDVHGRPATLSDIKASLQETGTGLIEWARRVQPDDMVTIDWDGTLRPVPKTILLTQAINHATEHRAQIMTIMTQLGVDPPSLDAWTYFDELDKESP